MISNIKFRKILNDLKRRPEDAAKDLKISNKKVKNLLSGKSKINLKLIEKAIKVWPINYGDFFSFRDDTKFNYKIMRSFKSEKSKRTMSRGGKPYYLYQDTVLSKLSPFKPELITELVIVNNNNPNNNLVKFNNGHFLHQFTYFIGPVNFYYIKKNKKKVAKMNTGDSMYISPYVPHSFTTRKNKTNKLGKILALTYSDRIDNESLNELSSLGFDAAKKYRLNLKNSRDSFWTNLNHYLKISSLSTNEFQRLFNLNLNKIMRRKNIPNYKSLNKIAQYLNLNVRDLLPPDNIVEVKIQKYKDGKNWYYPSYANKIYLFNELTNIKQLSNSKAYELSILINKNHNNYFEIPSHQYIYNLGNTKVSLKINNHLVNINPRDSIYIKPNIKHLFYKKGKLLVVRVAGRISGDTLYQLSMISEKNLKKTINDNRPWFNK